jgi:acetoacetyl-CoA reductase
MGEAVARIALVTGGTRGLGRAIALALKADGYSVAAVYRGNDEAAKKLQSEAGIGTYKWNVADFDACKLGVAQVEREVGPIDILVNNAGITSDVSLRHMTREQWQSVINVNLGLMFNMCPRAAAVYVSFLHWKETGDLRPGRSKRLSETTASCG